LIMLPPGLTDITIQTPTPEQRARYDQAVRDLDWRTANENRMALVFHFGQDRVYVPVSRSVFMQLQKVVQAHLGDVPLSPAADPPNEARTVWARLLEVIE
jgi:hypothetical protein